MRKKLEANWNPEAEEEPVDEKSKWIKDKLKHLKNKGII